MKKIHIAIFYSLISFFYFLNCSPSLKFSKLCDINDPPKFLREAIITALTSNQEFYCNIRIRNPSSNTQTGTGIATGTGTTTGTGIATGTGSGTPVIETVATPVFSPTAGFYNTPQTNITITTTTQGATIYYTSNGTTPTASSTLYTTGLGHIYPLAGLTIRAIAIKSGSNNSAVATAEYSYNVIKTGQTQCWDSAPSLISCTGTNHDGEFQRGVARGYTDNFNGTVTDNYSGLIWQKCSRGQSGGGCTPAPTADTWANQVNFCSGLGSAWRLPTLMELADLVEYQISPINSIFPNTPATPAYWTSTDAGLSVGDAINVSFQDGPIVFTGKGASLNVRCVSGASFQNQIFVDNGDNTIRDKRTNLFWQKCSFGQANDASCTGTAPNPTWNTAIGNCPGLSLASRTWRLPTINELRTLVDYSKTSAPSLNLTFFPNTLSTSRHWSSTTYFNGARQNAWYVNLNNSAFSSDSKATGTAAVRCVSGP